MRVCSAILLYNSKDKTVLLQHRDNNAPKFRNCWAFFGGGSENNENPLECVKRECFEELEVVLKSPEFVMKSILVDEEENLFVEEYDGVQKLVLHEGDNMKWFSREELEREKNIPLEIKKRVLQGFEFLEKNKF